MRACGNDAPRAFVVLYLFPVSEEGFAADSLFLGGFHRSPLLEYPPTCSSPGNFGGVFATSALGVFSRGGIFGSRPLDRKTWTQKFTPEIGFRCRVLRSRDARHHRGERARDRATDRASPNVRPTDRDASATCHRSGCERRDLGRAGVRACGGVAPRDARASSAFS